MPAATTAPGPGLPDERWSTPTPTAAPTVLMDDRALTDFLSAAVGEYRLITAEAPLPCFALLLGSAEGTTYLVRRIAFGRNARTRDPAARREFRETIVPRFGPAYENESRGWWMDSRDVLTASREADALEMDLLGSIHMHPDWHRLGPPSERGHTLSERPTPMDRHLFGRTGWPLNIICYLERRGGVFYHALAAWSPPPAREGAEAAECPQVPLRVRTSSLAEA
ncbi:hypothetical protein [Streptomyces griseus]|uniref:hypothetical protein n=1 Tax=Streptomyces griseus TaxID=1911 RepID=UPI00068A0903|nr:hypothetical protein [Streptomyces griseus]